MLAGVLAVAWALFAGLVLVLYRPGGPADLAVVVVAALPTLIALAGLVWPPVARSTRVFAAIAWLGVGVSLVLLPSLGGLLGQLEAGGTQTLLPSIESAYPWLLALAGTSLFAGLGVARARLGESALRGRRLALGVALALGGTALVGTLFAAAAIGNDIALRDRPAAGSRYGATTPGLSIPACNAPLALPATATVSVALHGDVDGRSIGDVAIDGLRNAGDAEAELNVATALELDRIAAARVGSSAWERADGPWTKVVASAAVGDELALDDRAVTTALAAADRATAEARGDEYVEGARARHCRIATDGPTFLLAFPATRRLVGDVDLHRWRGQLDYWLFADGCVGRITGSVNGDAAGLPAAGIQGTVRVAMAIVERGRPTTIEPPVAP